MSTASYGSVGQERAFYGTSAAAPQAAGMFALLMNRFGVPATSGDVDSLKSIAHAIASAGSNDLGSAGVDYAYGWGKFKFQYETELTFEQQPSDTAAAQVIAPNVSVGVLDDEGFLIRYGLLSNIGLAIGTNPSAGVLSQTSAGFRRSRSTARKAAAWRRSTAPASTKPATATRWSPVRAASCLR